MQKRYLMWNTARVQSQLNLPVDAQNVQSILLQEQAQSKCGSGVFLADNDEQANQFRMAAIEQTGHDLRYERLPDRLYVAVYPDIFSGFTEAREKQSVIDLFNNTDKPALVFTIEDLLNPQLMQAISDTVTLTLKAIGSSASFEEVIIDADDPERVFAWLHDYTQQ